MKRFWTAMAVALCTIFAVSGCNDYGNTFQSPGGAFVSFLSPSQIPACVSGNSGTCSDLTLTLNGSGFVAKTKVQWNGKNLVTTVPTDSSGNPLGNIVTAVVPAALLAKPGTATVNTINPNSNYGTGTNGLSNTITFIINNLANPIPTVTSVSPSCATAGSNLALTVTGANFLNSSTDPTQVSTVNWTLGALQMQLTAPTATITSTQITATIPAANISGAGNASVTVYNPPSPAAAAALARRRSPLRYRLRLAQQPRRRRKAPFRRPPSPRKRQPLVSMGAMWLTPRFRANTRKSSCAIPAKALRRAASLKLPCFRSQAEAALLPATATHLP